MGIDDEKRALSVQEQKSLAESVLILREVLSGFLGLLEKPPKDQRELPEKLKGLMIRLQTIEHGGASHARHLRHVAQHGGSDKVMAAPRPEPFGRGPK